jgi:hypothetical protein
VSAAGERGTVLKRANQESTCLAAPLCLARRQCRQDCSRATGYPPIHNSTRRTTTRIRDHPTIIRCRSKARCAEVWIECPGTYIWSRSLEVPLNGSNIANGLQTAPSTQTRPKETRTTRLARTTSHTTSDRTARSNCPSDRPAVCTNLSGWKARLVRRLGDKFHRESEHRSAVSVSSTYLNGATVSPTGLYAGSVPDVVGDFSSKGFGQVEWNGQYATSSAIGLPALWILSAARSPIA